MDCKRIQELIITDGADGEAGGSMKDDIRKHLANCAICREFKASFEEAAVKPFEDVPVEAPSETVWDKIRSDIESENSPKEFPDIREYLLRLLHPKRAVLVFAAAAALMILVNIFVIAPGGRQAAVNTYLQEEMESLYSLNGNGEDLFSDVGDSGFGTNIEAFFL